MKIKNIFTRSLLCAIQLFHPSKTCSIRCIVIEALNIRVNNSTPDKSIKMHAIQQPFLLIRFQHKTSLQLHNICRVRKYSTTVDKGHAIFLRWIEPSLLLRCPNCADSAPLPADPPAVSGPVSVLLNIKRIKSCKGAVHVLRSKSTNNLRRRAFGVWNQPPSKKLVDGI